MPELNDQLRLIQRLEREAKHATEALKLEQNRRILAERELENRIDFLELVEQTSGPYNAKKLASAAKATKTSKAEAVFCTTDWHSEENVDPSTVNGLNAYNLTICERRVARTFGDFLKYLEFSRQLYSIQTGVLWLGGDLINGYIHEELEESNFLGNAQAILFVTERLIEGIDLLLEASNLQHIRIVCNCGNHGRGHKQKRISTGYKNSWEWLAYHQLARYYAHEARVSFVIPNGYHAYLDVAGHVIRFHHGDGLKYHGGVGGLTIPVNKAIAQWNKSKYASFDIFGHYHTYLHNWNFLSVGCIVGYNAYAVSIKADFQPPTQSVLIVDKKQGPVLSLPIFC